MSAEFLDYFHAQREFEKRKLAAARGEVIPKIQDSPAIKQAPIQPAATLPKNAAGLFGDYPDLKTLMLEVDESRAKCKRAKKGASRETENELALQQFKPIIQAWIDAKQIPDKRVFAHTLYFAVGSGDYPFIIEMIDLSVELGIIDFAPVLKREMQAFVVDEIWNLCKKSYWYQPDGPRTKKIFRKKLPDWFWTIFDRICESKEWRTHYLKQNFLLEIAGYDALYRGNKEEAVGYWSRCDDLSERSGVKTALKNLRAEMNK